MYEHPTYEEILAGANAAEARAKADRRNRLEEEAGPQLDYEHRESMKALRGPLSQRATSAQFNEWMAREVCEYIDHLRRRLEALCPHHANSRDWMDPNCIWCGKEIR
jgi:hypothetical protein